MGPGGFDRLSLVIAILLAMIGVMGAFVTWRIGQLANETENASRAALAARREYTAAGVESATNVQKAWGDWLGYEVARRKAAALRNESEFAEAVRFDREASAFWGGVPNADIALDGTYDQAAHLDALTAAKTDGLDVFAQPHLDAAAAAESRAVRIGQIGFAVAGILPILTLAEITRRRRLSIALAITGAGGLAAGIVALVLAWA